MKVIVTPIDRHPTVGHPESYHSSGNPVTGKSLIVNGDVVIVDGVEVLRRDRRAKVHQTPGHPWLTSNGHADPKYRFIGWTSFRIEVEP